MNIVCYIHNRVTIRFGIKATLHEILKGRKPNVKYFYFFGSKFYIMEYREQRRNVDPKSENGYSVDTLSIARPTWSSTLIPRL